MFRGEEALASRSVEAESKKKSWMLGGEVAVPDHPPEPKQIKYSEESHATFFDKAGAVETVPAWSRHRVSPEDELGLFFYCRVPRAIVITWNPEEPYSGLYSTCIPFRKLVSLLPCQFNV